MPGDEKVPEVYHFGDNRKNIGPTQPPGSDILRLAYDTSCSHMSVKGRIDEFGSLGHRVFRREDPECRFVKLRN